MRIAIGFSVTLAFLTSGSTDWASAQERAEAMLDATRATLGGAVALGDVQSVKAEGRCVRVLGPLTLGSRITLTVVRPDKYLRSDVLSLPGRAATISTGFNGQRIIQRASTDDGRRLDAGELLAPDISQTIRSAVPGLRHELRLLLLGWFADAFDEFHPKADYLGIAEAPDATADAIRLTFPDGSAATLFTDRSSQLPLMVSWQAPDTLAPLRRPAGSGSSTGASRGPGPATETRPIVEHRVYFSDYRQVATLRWPFSVRREVGGQVIEEWQFDRVAVNTTVDRELFDAGR